MFFEYSSLLVATGVAAFATGLTLITSWLSDRSEKFLAACTSTMLAFIISIGLFIFYSATFDKLLGYLAGTILLLAFVLTLATAEQFHKKKLSVKKNAGITFVLLAISAIPYMLGYDGLLFIFFNAAAAALAATAGIEFWRCRAESPAMITAISTLFALLTASFAACALVLATTTPLVLLAPPANWAESLNMATSILSITGIGTLFVALNHQRQARRHLDAARTDAQTGLLNRRALFDLYGESGLLPGTTAIMFDLDNFKSINDQLGHAVGDRFLSLFADSCRQKLRPFDYGVRLGGEEFVVILPNANLALGLATAEAIRVHFAIQTVDIDGQTRSCTVSAGLHTNQTGINMPLDQMLRTVDDALYCAKHQGRNQVHVAKPTSKPIANPLAQSA